MQKVIVIVGPTGVGKTNVSVQLAKQFHGEIISGDSMQVYKELSIGTAKITEAEKQGVPHYLVDDRSYKAEYNVKVFQEQARAAIDEITKTGSIPIICGGTGLYIKSVLYDYQFMDQEEDNEFQSFLATLSNSQLHRLVALVDPKALDTIHKHNRQRLLRAITMAHNGKKKSDIIASQEHTLCYDAYIIGLSIEREQLYARINQRVDNMMDSGLLDEVKAVIENETTWDLQSMKSIGYKEWKSYLDGTDSIEACVEMIKKNSRNFAKRQYTWFKNQMEVHWQDIDKENWYEELLVDINKWLEVEK